mmetsp:Transcript_22489/g.39732  ORF Transcript_22489/g.39732 Transcript_22489/m.39732 type:complete len:604 (+) Transcript_22489:213-2024(+)
MAMYTAYAIQDIHKYIDIVRVSEKNVGPSGAADAARRLDGCKTLKELHFGGKRIGDEGARSLAGSLKGCKNLQTLVLSSNGIGDVGAKAFAEAIEGYKNLKTLDLSSNSIGSEGLGALVRGLARCESLEFLALSSNSIDEEGAKALAKRLAACKNLKTMYLSRLNMGDESAKELSKGLKDCKNLTELSLHSNNIGDEGAKWLGEGLKGCKSLIYLDLDHNKIGDEGAKELAKGLAECRKLETLELSSNKIGNGSEDEGVKALAKGLEKSSNLKYLDLQGNAIGREGAKAIARSLHKARAPVTIYIYNDWDYDGSPEQLFAKVCYPNEHINSPTDEESTYMGSTPCHEDYKAAKADVKKCPVCIEQHLLSEGSSCEQGHFLCRGCIARLLAAAAAYSHTVEAFADDGAMICMDPDCEGKIAAQDILRIVPTALNDLLKIAKMKVEIEMSAQFKRETQRRIAESLRAGEPNNDAQRHLLHIQEMILNTFCPNCYAIFDDIGGCCAVQCGNSSCKRYFCAWCLEHSFQDERGCCAHMRTCPKRLSRDPYFADSFKQVREAWQSLRADRLRAYWNANVQNETVRDVLRDQLAPLLTPDIVGAGFRLE